MKNLLILLLSPLSVFAQISTGIIYQTGRIEQLNINYDIKLSHNDSTFEYKIFSKFRYAESTEVTNRDIRNGAGVDFKPFWVLSPFILAEYRINHFMDISGKVNALTGIKWTFINKPDYKYSISGAIVYEKIDFVSDIPDKEIARMSIRQKIKHKLTDNISLNLVCFYKPGIFDFSDYDIETILSLSMKLSNRLSISVKNELEYWSNNPNKELEKYQNLVVISLEYKLK